jgi:hypothetical protein
LSRRPGLLIAALLHSALLAAPLSAQDAPSATAEEVIAAGKKAYSLPDRRSAAACEQPPQVGGEIVVCGQKDDGNQYRGPSSSDLDPFGAGAKDTIPRAPGVETVYPGVAVASGCFVGPCPPPMPVLIDLKAIPEAPPGSDADRIARGEKAQ